MDNKQEKRNPFVAFEPKPKAVEPVQEPKAPEPIAHEPEPEERPSFIISSSEDAYIADRMKSQPKTLDEVLQVKEKKYAPGEHRLSLPAELKGFEDRFAFRWLNKKKRAVDDAIDVKGWTLVRRALFPHLPKHLFTTAGAVERGDTILAFMPLKRAKEIRKQPGIKSARLIESNPMLNPELPSLPKGKSGLYKPEDTSSEKETQTGFQEDRDF